MLKFSEGKALEYKQAMGDLFPMFRMWLSDEVDAIITHFLAEGTITLSDLVKVKKDLGAVVKKLATKYPGMMPTDIDADISTLTMPATLRYTCEQRTYNIVFNLTHTLIHLQASTEAFIAIMTPKKK